MRRAVTIARHTVRSAFHSRPFLVLAIVVVLLTPLLPWLLRTSERQTLEDELKLVITYSLALTQVILALITLFLGATVLTEEIAGRQIFILDSKPIKRWEIVAGKFLGLVAINFILLVVMTGVNYGAIRIAVGIGADNEAEAAAVRSALLTARRSIRPEPPQYLARAERMYEEKLKGGELRQDVVREEYIRTRAQELQREAERVGPGQSKTWIVENVPPPVGDRRLTLRVRYTDRHALDENTGDVFFVIGESGVSPEVYRGAHPIAPNSYFEFQIPYDAVIPAERGEGGTLKVMATNIDPERITMVFEDRDALEVLVPAGTFAGNMARGMVLIFMQLIFLCAVGMLFSSFVSMPVALTGAFTVYMLMVVSGLAETVMGSMTAGRMPETLGQAGHYARNLFFQTLFTLVPSAERYSPVEPLSTGRFVPWSRVGSGILWVVLLRSGLCVLAASIVFSLRELARTTES